MEAVGVVVAVSEMFWVVAVVLGDGVREGGAVGVDNPLLTLVSVLLFVIYVEGDGWLLGVTGAGLGVSVAGEG